MEQPNSSLDDDEELSGTDEDVCIDPALIHQPTPGLPGAAYSASHAQQQPTSRASSVSLSVHDYPTTSKRVRMEGHPYPRSRSRAREALEHEQESENDSNTNSSFGRSATSTPFDDAYEGANVGVNNIVSGINNMNNSNIPAAANANAIRPMGRQLSAVPGYFQGSIPVSLNEFNLNYGVSGGTGMPMSSPGGGTRITSATPMYNVNAPSGMPSRQSNHQGLPAHHHPQQSFHGQILNTNAVGVQPQVQHSRSLSRASSSMTSSGFAAHASRAVSFSAAAAANTSGSGSGGAQLPFGQTARDDIEIVQAGGGLPVARRVSHARAQKGTGHDD
ncbi:hypothetical protein SCHPADRAFT_464858 [Schizopora paradoxa]|uniref:Uncharacterized protein n=1 Tax=Schizopora paradoxa TaxID=27342 RepID=A0A0H2RHX2_9AGAM|nr:hypothetical protein SCHPADRAFT_464858 [Schizopora paradoxa]